MIGPRRAEAGDPVWRSSLDCWLRHHHLRIRCKSPRSPGCTWREWRDRLPRYSRRPTTAGSDTRTIAAPSHRDPETKQLGAQSMCS